MIGRIRSRREFDALRTDGVRIRRGPLSVTFLEDPSSDDCRLAFAIPRRTATAVRRNRIRRRLRALFVDLDRQRPELVPNGLLLVGAAPSVADRPAPALREDLIRLLETLRLRRGGA